jgi:hypothetical protein
LAFVLLVSMLVFSRAGNPGVSFPYDLTEQTGKGEFESAITRTYKACALSNALDYQVFRLAVIGYAHLKAEQLLSDKEIIVIIDYTKSANDRRFFVIDLSSQKILNQTLVAHGKHTGNKYAQHFSNEPRTQKSSLGFFITGETYYGTHGYSLKLDGVDSLYNDNARARQIVVHGAHYVSDAWAKKYGRIGRSWGCPALPEDVAQEVIDRIKGGCCMFAYYNDKDYLESSKYLMIDNKVMRTAAGLEN